jgi:hypothetical protein
MNEEYQERECDQFDVENDQICDALAEEARAHPTAYDRIKRHVRGIAYTEGTYKNSFACRD